MNTKAGILGSGQLAWMLQTQGTQFGLNVRSIHEPNQLTLQDFVEGVDILTFESEFFHAAGLKRTLQDFKGFIFPSLDCLGLLQDRLTQKQSLQDHDLPTSPFWFIKTPEELTLLFKKHKKLVAKKRRGGYDGYGTFILKSQNDLETFIDRHSAVLIDFIFESFIPFEKEMALQVGRSRTGDISFLPLVTTVQKDNKCFYVVGPEKPQPALQKKITKWLNKIDYVGVIGIELFSTKKGLIINEVAPRVHNTGHHSLDSCSVDQFTLHWLCALQDKLPKVEIKSPAFVMLNLIGKSEDSVVFPKQLEGAVYWYRKSNRLGRKLGHINWTGKNKRALIQRALSALKKWKF